MKKMIAALALTVIASSAIAATATGTVKVTDLRGSGKQSSIIIEGAAAKKLFYDLNDENIMSIDAAESPNGTHTIYKTGENILCELQMGIPGHKKEKVKCAIQIENKSTGKVGEAAVG